MSFLAIPRASPPIGFPVLVLWFGALGHEKWRGGRFMKADKSDNMLCFHLLFPDICRIIFFLKVMVYSMCAFQYLFI